jgi:predicted PurR-regulated permease PerM
MSSRFTINREMLTKVFFFAAFAFLLYQLFLLAKPFLGALLVSIILGIACFPLHRRLRSVIPNPHLSALISTVQNIMESLRSGDLHFFKDNLPPWLADHAATLVHKLQSINVDVETIVMDNIRDLGFQLTTMGSFVARNAIFIFFKLMVAVLSLFFIFRDGETIFNKILKLIPLEQHHKIALAKNAYETFRAVTIGVFLTAATQGFTAMIGFLIAGIRLPVLLGFATAFTSLLGASFIVTLPVALFVMINNTGWGIFLLLWGMLVVGLLDNFLKPILIGSRARMPFVLVFFSLLGGLKMYGLLGLVLGPILVASVLTFIRIYREAYTP